MAGHPAYRELPATLYGREYEIQRPASCENDTLAGPMRGYAVTALLRDGCFYVGFFTSGRSWRHHDQVFVEDFAQALKKMQRFEERLAEAGGRLTLRGRFRMARAAYKAGKSVYFADYAHVAQKVAQAGTFPESAPA